MEQPPHSISESRFDFDDSGPSLAGVRLLVRGRSGFAPKTREALETELQEALGCRFDCSVFALRLDLISRSLNQRDIAKAAIATQFLDPPTRLEDPADLGKAAVDDPERPGWPKGAPDGQGGEFRPKTDGGLRASEAQKSASCVCGSGEPFGPPSVACSRPSAR